MTELTSSKGYPNTENDFHTRASPRKSSRNGDGMFLDPLITKSPHKRGRDTDASSRNGQSKGVSRKSDCKYYYKKVFKQLVDTINKSLKSPPRSPSSKAKFNLDENMVELELEPDTDFEQSLRYFEYSRETVKAYWFIPLKEILNSENNEVRLESLPFPANHNKKWRFMAEISKNQAKLTKVYFGIESILNEDEEKNLEWKREPYVFIRITLKKNNFDIEKGFNRTFSNKCKDSGIIQQEKGLADIDLNANDYFIIESLIRENKVTKNNTSEYVGLINAGNTCYMNSFLQTLYHLPAFARSVYKVPFTSDKPESIPTALQKLFYNLKYSRKPVTTTELIKSFGWDKKQAWIQQDVQEFCCLLLAALENKTKGIAEVEGTINDLFEGKVSSIIKCIDVDFTSVREEKFLEIQLMVKGMRNIYQSLDYFVQEEELKGDNKYDAESYGKQDATKHILFEKLPPVLLILLKRFEYDYQTDTNVKINDSCEYYDEIDMGKYMMPEHNQETKYRLFSVLVHSGSGTSSGHYYVFIRPGGPSNSKLDDCFTKMIDGKWFKLNDELVGFAEPGDVFEANFGGTHTEAKLNEKKEIQTWEATNESNAYMIVYIREDQIKTLLKPIADIDVPRRLIEDIEKNKKIEEERRKKGEDFFKVYLTSFELLTDLDHPGLTFYKMGSKDDDCYNRFLQNKRKRIKVYLKKNFKVYDLLKFVSENSGIPQDQIMIWKISLAKEQISQVLKRGYLTSSPNVSVLANGVNSNQTKSIFFVHTLDRKRYPRIFNVREKYVSSFFDINCKNMLEFVNYNNSPIEIEDRSDKIEVEAPEKDSSKVEELLKTQNQLFLDLLDEKYLLVFLKNYTCRNGEPRIELRDFFLINKTLFVHDLLEVIQHRDENFEKENIIFYREDKKKYLLEPLQLKDALDDESADQGLVCVMEHKGLDFQGINYKTAQEHYQQLSNRVWVTFVPNDVRENAMKTLQDGNMPYAGIIEYVSKNLFNGEVDPERILLKAKFKNAFAFNPVPYDEDGSVKLVDLLKHDDKVFCEVSKIEVNQLHKKLKCLVSYYSVITNNCTNEEEVFVEKNSTVQKLLEDIQNFALFADERNNDRETLNRSAQLRLILVDKKKNKLIGQAQNDQSLGPYVQKYRLRVELVPDEYDSESVKDPNEKFYPVLCVHATKDGEYFSNPFLFFSKKTVSGNTLRENLYDYIKDWEVYCDKKIIITKDYFNKIKFILKSEISESKYTKLEPEENYPFQELDPEAKKYTLELIHPFNMPNNHAQMKIST